jgi:hypothetical protein
MQPLVGHKSELKDIAVGVRMSCYGWDYAWEDALREVWWDRFFLWFGEAVAVIHAWKVINIQSLRGWL